MTVEKLIEKARQENWDEIDKILPEVCDSESYVRWAANQGIFYDDDNIRDLAASILEKTNHPYFSTAKDGLKKMTISDSNPYARFRAGFALYAHGDRSKDVLKVLEDAMADEDVANIAKGYLNRQ